MKVGLKKQEEIPRPKLAVVEVPPIMQLGEYQDVIAIRTTSSERYSNVPYVVGTLADGASSYGWGYVGTGSLDFAANILLHFSDHDHAVTNAYRNAFCLEFLASMPQSGGRIPKEFVISFIERMKESRPDLLEAARQELKTARA